MVLGFISIYNIRGSQCKTVWAESHYTLFALKIEIKINWPFLIFEQNTDLQIISVISTKDFLCITSKYDSEF